MYEIDAKVPIIIVLGKSEKHLSLIHCFYTLEKVIKWVLHNLKETNIGQFLSIFLLFDVKESHC